MIGAYFFQFIWGLIVLAAFVGWGGLVYRMQDINHLEGIDWGLRAGWGMGLMLVIGGVLSLLGIVSAGLLITLVLPGAGFWVAGLLKNRSNISTPTRFQIIAVLAVTIPLLIRYASVVHYQAFSCGDDDIAYFPFISRLLQTGTLLDPFSLRRLAAYGGQTFLQALIGATGSEDNAFLMDRGIAVCVSLGLTLGFYRNRPGLGVLPYALTLLLIFVLPFPLLNSASQTTGLAMFLTLFRTLERSPDPARIASKTIWLIGMIVAATASLRAHFLLAGALTIVVYWGISCSQHRNHWRAHAASLIHVGGTSLVCLLPWMTLLQLSSRTFLYPIFRGTHRPEFENYQATLDIGEHLELFFTTLFDARFLIFAAPIILFVFYRKNAAAFALYVSALLTTAAMTWVFTHSDLDNIHRYVAPFLNAAIIATMIAFTRDARAAGPAAETNTSPFRLGDKIIVVALALLLPVMMKIDIERFIDRWDRVALSPAKRTLYTEMQNTIPAGAKIMAIFNAPYALNYQRNDISAIDVPGAASPDPGMPFFDGPEAFKKYLQNLSITHLAYGDFDEPGGCLYNRNLWQYHQGADVDVWKMEARYYLTLIDLLEALGKTEKVMFKKNGFTALQLNAL